MKPRVSLPDSASDPWYMNIPMGYNALATFLKYQGSIDTSNKSNHSLRATAISRMCETNVPHKAFVEGSKSLRVSAFKDHEATDMHKRAMVCSRRVVRVILPNTHRLRRPYMSTLDPVTETKLKRKFEIA